MGAEGTCKEELWGLEHLSVENDGGVKRGCLFLLAVSFSMCFTILGQNILTLLLFYDGTH